MNRIRLFWRVKETVSKSFKDFSDWKKMNAVRRFYRLRTPFALEIQQIFTSTISRVGMPVPPPLTQPLPLSVGYFDSKVNKYTEILKSESEYASRLVTRSEDKVKIRYLLTGKFLIDFKRRIIEIHNELKSELAGSGETDEKPGPIKKKIQKIQAIIGEFDNSVLELKYLDSKKMSQIGKIGMTKNVDWENPNQQALFVINVQDLEKVE